VGNVRRARRSLGEVSEKTVRGWVESEEWRGAQRYPVWYISGLGRAQKRGQDNEIRGETGRCSQGLSDEKPKDRVVIAIQVEIKSKGQTWYSRSTYIY